MNDKIRDLIMAIPPENIDEVGGKIADMLHGVALHKSPLRINKGNVVATHTPQSKICPACNQDIRGGNPIPIWDNLESSYAHPDCVNTALKNGWSEGHHNIAKRSHNSWLVFWRGECAEVKTRKEAKELLKQLSEGDLST